jgi:hypothetical protein
MSQFSRREGLGRVLLCLAAAAVLSACGSGVENTKEQVVAEYIKAVQAGDSGRLRELSSPEFAPTAIAEAIDQKLASAGRRRWNNVVVTWSEVMTPQDGRADITATDDQGGAIKDRVYVVLIKETWRVALGGRDCPEEGAADLASGMVESSQSDC